MRLTTDLLNREFVFSQQTPLTPSKFIKAFEQRVLEREFCLSDWEQLEELHRVGVLVPIFRFEKNTRFLLRKARQEKRSASSMWLGRDVSFAMNLYRNDEVGTLIDPQTEAYRTWYSFIRSYKTDYLYPNNPNNQEKIGFFWSSSFLFSSYQLLLIPKLRNLLAQMQRHRRRRKHPSNWKFQLRLDERQQEEIRKEAKESRNLVIALTALEARYLPQLRGHRFSAIYTGHDSFVEALITYQQSFDPTALLNWISWDVDKVKETAEKLLWQADTLDPLRDWYELVRMCHPDMLNKLRGDALVALDHRRAAEMLLLFYEDLQVHGGAPPFAEVPKYVRGPHETRLKYELGVLDEVLMKFGLSPQPSLILIIEGETEEYIIPKAMDLLGISQISSFIKIFKAGGVNKDFELLARYIAPPYLGKELENAVLLTRPATHFLVTVDAESDFENSEKRGKLLNKWLDGIYGAVPEKYRKGNMRNDLSHFVHIETWDDVFEFAHFTDNDLAEALLNAHGGSDSPPKDYLIQKLATMREPNKNKDVEKILSDWNYKKEQEDSTYIPGRKVGKTDLAKILWPILENRIREAKSKEELNAIPLSRILLKAEHLAALSGRKDIALRT